MKIGILGTGNVGSNLGIALARAGHEICYGSREPDSERVQALVAETGQRAQATQGAEAAAFGEIVIIALAWQAALGTIPSLPSLAGKVVVDATNAVAWDRGPVMGVDTSMGEMLAAALPEAHLVKGFNTIGIEHVLDPHFGGLSADMFICGDNPEAKEIVAGLCHELGFQPRDAGPIRNAGLLENLAMLWIHMASFGDAGRDIAFKLLQK